MEARIALITLLTDDISAMVKFYREVLGFRTKTDTPQYTEFEHEGVRFSICSRQVMHEVTDGHTTYKETRKGQAFELAFPCETAEEVQTAYDRLVHSGATPIKAPSKMPWGQTTAFFADPEGNIHELFAD